jgi:hypothetical protein
MGSKVRSTSMVKLRARLTDPGRDRVLWVLLLTAAAYFLVYYLSDPALPGGAGDPLSGWFSPIKSSAAGWFGFYDQGQYLNIAHTIAGLHFSQLATPGVYTYGIGYPLTGVIGEWLGFTKDPFVFFDLFAFLFATYAIYRVGTKRLSPAAGVFAAFGLVFATPLIGYVDQPWNSTVCLTVMSFLLLTFACDEVTRSRAFTVGLMLGWSFAARFVDIVWLSVIAVGCTYRGSWRDLGRRLLPPAAIGVLLFVLPVLYLNYKAFGSPFKTPYVTHLRTNAGSDQGLAAYNLRQVPNSALGIFVSPFWAGSNVTDRGFLINDFWALWAVPGFVLLWRRRWHRVFLVAAAVMLCVDWIFYLSFRASGNYSLEYGELHYFKDFWPVIALIAAGLADAGVRRLIAEMRTDGSAAMQAASPHADEHAASAAAGVDDD